MLTKKELDKRIKVVKFSIEWIGKGRLSAEPRKKCLIFLYTEQAPSCRSGVRCSSLHLPRCERHNKLKKVSYRILAVMSLLRHQALQPSDGLPAPRCTPLYYRRSLVLATRAECGTEARNYRTLLLSLSVTILGLHLLAFVLPVSD